MDLKGKISSQLAESLVEKTMSILGKNINIMDERGMIIASGDRERINSFHEGAVQVIEKREFLEISCDESQNLMGAQPGVNLPIEFNDNIVGVVGITGNPEEVKNYGILVKNLVELMIKEAFLTKETEFELRIRNNLIHELLSLSKDSGLDEIVAMSEVLGLNLFMNRRVFLIEIADFANAQNSKANFRINGKMYLHQLLDNLIKSTSLHLNPQDLVTFTSSDKLIILKAMEDAKDNKEALLDSGNALLKQISQNMGFDGVVGIGELVSDPFGIRSSYKQALEALRIGQTLYSPDKVFIYEELTWGRLVDSIPEDIMIKFTETVLPKKLLGDDKLVETLRCFVDNNLNVAKTADKLYIHRNTLLYRLNCIQKSTGRSPQLFHDAMLFKLAFILRDYHRANYDDK